MQALRQLGVGVLIAIASVVLVLGGIFLSLAETLPSPATPTQIPPTLPLSFPTPTATVTSLVSTATMTETASPSPTTTVQATATTAVVVCTPPSGWIRVSTSASDTIYSLAQRYKTTAENLSTANCLSSFDLPAGFALYVPPVPTVTVIPCGHPAGWVRAHVVQRGDTLFRIALSYGVTYPQLQRANCMGSSTTIYAGQRLWVPNIPPRTVPPSATTTIPDFPTETSPPPVTTAPPSDTSAPPTTPPATATTQPPPTDAPTTQPPPQ